VLDEYPFLFIDKVPVHAYGIPIAISREESCQPYSVLGLVDVVGNEGTGGVGLGGGGEGLALN
jgi:hypothetical protein